MKYISINSLFLTQIHCVEGWMVSVFTSPPTLKPQAFLFKLIVKFLFNVINILVDDFLFLVLLCLCFMFPWFILFFLQILVFFLYLFAVGQLLQKIFKLEKPK